MAVEHIVCKDLGPIERQEMLKKLPIRPQHVALIYGFSGLPHISTYPHDNSVEAPVEAIQKYISFCESNDIAAFTDLRYALNQRSDKFRAYICYVAENFGVGGNGSNTNLVDSLKRGAKPARIRIVSDDILNRRIDVKQYDDIILPKAHEVCVSGYELFEGKLEFKKVENVFRDNIQISQDVTELQFNNNTPGYDYGIGGVKNFLVELGGEIVQDS